MELPFSFHSLFFLSISLPLSLSPSLFLSLCPRSWAKSHSSLLTERSFQLFFTARPLCPSWDSLPHGGNVLPPSCYMRASSTHALLYSWTRSVCVCACLWSSCWRYLIPFIVHLTRIPGGMRIRVEYPDTLYRCLMCTWEKKEDGGRGKPRGDKYS